MKKLDLKVNAVISSEQMTQRDIEVLYRAIFENVMKLQEEDRKEKVILNAQREVEYDI